MNGRQCSDIVWLLLKENMNAFTPLFGHYVYRISVHPKDHQGGAMLVS